MQKTYIKYLQQLGNRRFDDRYRERERECQADKCGEQIKKKNEIFNRKNLLILSCRFYTTINFILATFNWF